MSGRLIILVLHLFVLGALLTVVSQQVHRFDRQRRRADWIKYLVYLSLVMLILAIVQAGKVMTAAMLISVALAGACEVYRCIRFQKIARICLAVSIFVLLAVCLLHPVIIGQRDWAATVSFLFLIVCVTDSFSQLWGRLLGRRRLSRLSPNKTWEGLLGGAVTATGCAAILSFLLPYLALITVLVLGFAAVVAAIMGDLLFSLIKRKLKIKDFSSLLPGHGGILDRFDSLVVAAPVFFWAHKALAP